MAVRTPHPRLYATNSRVLGYNEYTVRTPPYGAGLEKHKHLSSWVGNAYTRNILVEERDHPYSGTNLCLGARALSGGQSEHLGTSCPPLLRLRIQSPRPRRFRRRLADLIQRHCSLLRPGGSLSRHHRRPGRSALSARQHLSTATQAELRGAEAEKRHREDGPGSHAVPRRRHHRRSQAQQVSFPMPGTRRLRA